MPQWLKQHWLASIAVALSLFAASKVLADAEMKGTITEWMRSVDQRLGRIEDVLDGNRNQRQD